jgi:DNA-binding GntR family transcriptional regulator
LRKQKIDSKIKEKNRVNLFSDQAYSSIKEMILNLKIQPDDRLTELKLAPLLEMSRTPVREALKRLEIEGLITSYGKSGYLLNIPTFRVINNLYEVRTILEGGAAKLAVKNIDLTKVSYYEERFESIKNQLNHESEGGKDKRQQSRNPKNLDKGYDVVKLGREFHFFIIENSENEELIALIKRIYDQISISRIFSFQRRRVEALDEHLKIVKALQERNGEASQRLVEEHLKNAFETVTKIF